MGPVAQAGGSELSAPNAAGSLGRECKVVLCEKVSVSKMPKTRLTAKLCSAPTQKSHSSCGPSPTATPTSPPTKASALPPSVPKSPSTTPAASLPLSPTKPSSSKPPPPPSSSKPPSPPPPPPPPPPAKPAVAKVVHRASSSRTAAKLAASEASQGEPASVPTKLPPPLPVPTIVYNASPIDFSVYRDACDSVSDSDSDEGDLPDAISFDEVGSRLPVKGDAVWVKYRSQNFWPTLVLQSHIKSKKLHVLFLDDKPVNGQHSGQKVYMKYNKQRVLPYNHENRSKFEADGKLLESPELRKQFQAALSKMVDYLTKRALGHKAACKAFLNEPASSEDEEEADVKKDNPPPPPSTTPVSATKLQPTPAKRKRKSGAAKKEENGENTPARRKKVMTPSERRAMRKQKNQPLVDFICSSEMKNHLTKIYREETTSERHRQFTQGGTHHRTIEAMYASGPIDDDAQLETILTFIGGCYQELTGQKLPDMDYLFCVWLPEAIIYAIAKVKRCGQKKALEIFDKGIKLTKSEHMEIHHQLTRR